MQVPISFRYAQLYVSLSLFSFVLLYHDNLKLSAMFIKVTEVVPLSGHQWLSVKPGSSFICE